MIVYVSKENEAEFIEILRNRQSRFMIGIKDNRYWLSDDGDFESIKHIAKRVRA